MPEEETTDAQEITGFPRGTEELVEYTCARCEYKYRKAEDFPPFLCYRCLRFIAKRVWTTVHTLQPVSRPNTAEI